MTAAPVRIQRTRTKGWKMPEGAVYVGRPTRWGNPFTVTHTPRQGFVIFDDSTPESGRSGFLYSFPTSDEAIRKAILLFKKKFSGSYRFERRLDIYQNLRGRDLVCWCPLDKPCHADVLLAIANREAS